MSGWIKKLHGFLLLNEGAILQDAGRISHELAISFAESEYEKFRLKMIAGKVSQPDDFEKTIKEIGAKTIKKRKQ